MDSNLDTQNQTVGQAIQQSFTGAAKDAQKGSFAPFGDDGFSFLDVLDIINPLQHIPVVSTLYRQATGDELGAAPRVAGGALFGGPIGAITSLVNVVVEEVSGKDLGEHAVEWFDDGAQGPQVAADWPENGLAPASVETEELPPLPGQMAANTPAPATDEDPVTAWARATMNGTMVAAAHDPVTLWAQQESRIRVAEAPPLPAAADPVANWAAGEVNARHAGAHPVNPVVERVAENTVGAWARTEAAMRREEAFQVAERASQGQIGTQAPADAGVIALLHEARMEADVAQAAHHQSTDLAEKGRDDHGAETLAGESVWRGEWSTAAVTGNRQMASLGSDDPVDPAFAKKG